ncbi:MAG: helix-turn-helix domain-containing protein [Thermoplasmata archaeon]
MPVVGAHVRVHHPCPYCDISAEFPRTLLLLWCDNRRDVFLVSAPDPPELRRVVSALRDSLHARCLVVDGKDALVTVPDFEWADPPSVTGLARKTGVWVLHPVVYFEGKETYRFVASRKSELNRLIKRVRRLGMVEILSVTDHTGLGSVRDLPIASVHFFEGLTDRQARSLVAGFEGGLFDVPARARWNEIARREGLSRSTFGEHLRKGQLRLLANSHESLKARIAGAAAPLILPATAPERKVRRNPLQGTRAL